MTLNEIRKELNLSIEELAKELGISPAYVKNNGTVDITDASSQVQASIKLLKKLKEHEVPGEYVRILVNKSDINNLLRVSNGLE